MVKSNSLRVHLMVLLYDSFNSGLSHAESARIHGVGVSTSRYAARWCRRIHSAAESFVSRQGLNDLHYYRTMIARDIRESLSLQESCARHGCPPSSCRCGWSPATGSRSRRTTLYCRPTPPTALQAAVEVIFETSLRTSRLREADMCVDF